MKIKRFINNVLLILILLLTGFLFWLGYQNNALEENSVGVVYTKTSGWDMELLTTDKFNWSFQKVIPQNYSVHSFRLEFISLDYNDSGKLPSADLYANYNSIDGSNFNYNYNFSGSFKLDRSYLTTLVSSGEFTSDSFDKWLLDQADEIKNILDTYIYERMIDNELFTLNGAAREYVAGLYPHLSFTEFYINLNSPDITLYNNCRNRYLQNLETQTTADETYLVEMLKQQNEEKLRLDLLKQYGEVFTEYPIMIEYLKVDRELNLDRATITDFVGSDSQN